MFHRKYFFKLSVFFSGAVMVWGCFSRKGVGILEHIPTTMDKEVYKGILSRNLKESAKRLGLSRGFVFQQDNDPKHTSKVVRKWFEDNRVTVMDWPAQSPDLNPIENLWGELERKLRLRGDRPKNAGELIRFLTEEWECIPRDTVEKLVDSMPRRIEAVLAAKGGHTKY